VLQFVGVADRPADPLHQLTGEMLGLKAGARDPLPVDDLAGALGRIGDHQYLRHLSSSSSRFVPSIASQPSSQVNLP
jgi:hypothetical protein